MRVVLVELHFDQAVMVKAQTTRQLEDILKQAGGAENGQRLVREHPAR